jgi:hypothetical protein
MPLRRGKKIKDEPIRTLQSLVVNDRLTSQDLLACYLSCIQETNMYVAFETTP